MRREVEELQGGVLEDGSGMEIVRGREGGRRGGGEEGRRGGCLTLRGGLRRRVTINDCEIRIRGGRVSVQRGGKK